MRTDCWTGIAAMWFMMVACGPADDDASSGGAGDCVPGCFTPVSDAFAACTPSGSCTTETSMMPAETRICYSNGVKAVASFDTMAMTLAMTYSKDGTTCGSTETTTGSSTSTVTYKDGNGNTLATQQVDVATPRKFKLQCNAMSYDIDLDSPACKAYTGVSGPPPMGMMCAMGSCPP